MNNVITTSNTGSFIQGSFILPKEPYYNEEGLYDFVWYEIETGDVFHEGKMVVETIEILKQKALIDFLKAYPTVAEEIEDYQLKFRKW